MKINILRTMFLASILSAAPATYAGPGDDINALALGFQFDHVSMRQAFDNCRVHGKELYAMLQPRLRTEAWEGDLGAQIEKSGKINQDEANDAFSQIWLQSGHPLFEQGGVRARMNTKLEQFISNRGSDVPTEFQDETDRAYNEAAKWFTFTDFQDAVLEALKPGFDKDAAKKSALTEQKITLENL